MKGLPHKCGHDREYRTLAGYAIWKKTLVRNVQDVVGSNAGMGGFSGSSLANDRRRWPRRSTRDTHPQGSWVAGEPSRQA